MWGQMDRRQRVEEREVESSEKDHGEKTGAEDEIKY